MGMTTSIEWTDSSLNMMMGCDGCELWNPKVDMEQCYAGTLTTRYAGGKGWPVAFDQPTIFPERLKKALSWSDLTGKERPDKPHLNGYPRLIFLDDMGDTFTESLPIDWLMPHISAMEQSPHIYQFLTKRPKRMLKFFQQLGRIPANFWLMTSVTNQETTGRISDLLRIKEIDPVAILGLSVEPLLGPVDLWSARYPWPNGAGLGSAFAWGPPLRARQGRGINWVIVGGESGPKARPMHPQWARDLRDQCQAAGAAFFFKQHGEWMPVQTRPDDPLSPYSPEDDIPNRPNNWVGPDGKLTVGATHGEQRMAKVGKHAAGRLLDGRTWDEFPQPQKISMNVALGVPEGAE